MVSGLGRLAASWILALGLACADRAAGQTLTMGPLAGEPARPDRLRVLPDGAELHAPWGIAFGPQHLPESLFSSTYTGTVWLASPVTVLAKLEAARKAHARVILNLTSTPGSQNPDGSFSLELWKKRVDRFKGINFEPYIANGTLLGHYLMDEPHSAKNWDGQPVPFADIEAAGRYSKQLWLNMTTFVRTHPGFLEGAAFPWVHVDAAWAQYSARRGDARAYVQSNVASARSLRLGLVLGMNVLTGGTSDSGIPGFHEGTWAMSASQVKAWGSILAAEPYACAFSLWKYDKANPAYFERPDIQSAAAEVSRLAANRPQASCRVR
jgi:hypothetical protein